MITVYRPALSVKLYKLVARKDGVAARYVAAERTIDLTPYLGDGGSVRTTKSTMGAAGGFVVSFVDQPDPVAQDTLYALIEPMDLIEIRASRTPHLYAGQPLPLIMRGFVSSIRRSEGMTADGTPERAVVISGQDSGKLWQITQVIYELAQVIEGPFLDTFQLQVTLGLDVAPQSVGKFMTGLVGVMNKKVAALAAVNPAPATTPAASNPAQFLPFQTAITVPDGVVIPQTVMSFGGALWNLVETVGDRPWNEVFIQDQEAGPTLVFRPAPFKDINGAFIVPGATDPGTVALDISDVVAMDWERSDARIANFFWVPPGKYSFDTGYAVAQANLYNASLLDLSYGNNLPALYGYRKLETPSELTSNSLAGLPTMLPPGQQAAGAVEYINWAQTRAMLLKAMNRDNGVLEEGSMTVKGSEDIQAGMYLQLTRGGLTSEAYIMQVSHTITPLNTWVTQLALVRGTSFLVRNKMNGSPYWAEGRAGPYTS